MPECSTSEGDQPRGPLPSRQDVPEAGEHLHPRRAHVGARAELFSVTAELMEFVGLLDVLNQARFRAVAELLASWESARNVAGPIRVREASPGGGHDGGLDETA